MRHYEFQSFPGEIFCSFTYEEEESIAKTVMDFLSHIAVRGEDFDFVFDRFWMVKAANGNMCRGSDLLKFTDLLSKYGIPEPVIKFDGRGIAIPHSVGRRKLAPEERKSYRQIEVLRIWYDAWRAHPRIKICADEFSHFPGMNLLESKYRESIKEDLFKKADQVEAEYWAEFDKQKADNPLEHDRDIHKWIGDYKRRGLDVLDESLHEEWIHRYMGKNE